MLLFTKPTSKKQDELLRRSTDLPGTFQDHLGVTRTGNYPQGFNVDRNIQPLGKGEAVFDRAQAALRSWSMYPAWAEVYPGDTPLGVASVFTVTARVLGLYYLLSCRIAYTIDESGSDRSYSGFAITTLPGHPERGEELFAVEWDHKTDEVHYRIEAVSLPGNWLIWPTYPYGRYLQKRFARDSKAAMLAATSPNPPTT